MNTFTVPTMTLKIEELIERWYSVKRNENDIDLFLRAEQVQERFDASPYRTYKRLDKFIDRVEAVRSEASSLEQYTDSPIVLTLTPIHPDRFKRYVRSKIQNINAYKWYYGDKTAKVISEDELKTQEEEERYSNPTYYLSDEELENYFN